MQEKIESNLKMLHFRVADSGKILETKNVTAIERHGSTLESRTLERLEVGPKIWKPIAVNLRALLNR